MPRGREGFDFTKGAEIDFAEMLMPPLPMLAAAIEYFSLLTPLRMILFSRAFSSPAEGNISMRALPFRDVEISIDDAISIFSRLFDADFSTLITDRLLIYAAVGFVSLLGM